MSTALLVIDAQNAFFDRALGQPVFEAASVLANLTGLLARARHQNVPVIFVQHCEDEGEFARSDPRWLLHTDLGVRADEPVIEKTTPDSFYHTGLAAILDRHNAQHLVIAGNQTEFCVDTTCRAAKSR
ncbi:MAG: isochorismatase family protein, partial [Pseudomonadota bacterium]